MPFCIKKTVCVLLITMLCPGFAGAVLGESDTSLSETPKNADSVIARVNDIEIFQSELEKKFSLIKDQYAKTGAPLDDAKLDNFKDTILNSLIEQEVLFQESRAQGVTLDPEEIQSALDNLKKQFDSEAVFQEKLSAIDFSEDALAAQMRKGKTIEKFFDEKVMPTIEITEEELRDYYDAHSDEFKLPERIHASHILVKVAPDASKSEKERAKNKIKGIRLRLDAGDAFAELAKEVSDCPSSATGGDLGFFIRGKMVKPFEDAAFGLNAGATSDVVETPFGYHIIRVHEKQPAKALTYEEIREELTARLKKDKFKEMFPAYMETLKAKYTIEIP